MLAVELETHRAPAVRNAADARAHIFAEIHRRALVVVAHHVGQGLDRHLLFRLDVQRHLVGGILAHREIEIAVGIELGAAQQPEGRPHACLASPQAAPIGGAIGIAEAEFRVAAAEETFLPCEGNHVGRIEAVLRVVEREMVDAALVRVRANHSVGNAHRYPDGAFLLAFAHDLKDPALFLVGDGKALALRAIAIFLDQLVHHADRFAGRAGALQRHIDQRTVVDDAVFVLQMGTAAEGGLHNDELVLVHIAHRLVGMGHLGDLAAVVSAVPVVDIEQGTRRMVGGRTEIQFSVKLVGISRIGYHTRTIGRSALGHDHIGAGICGGTAQRQQEQAGRQSCQSSHSHKNVSVFAPRR